MLRHIVMKAVLVLLSLTHSDLTPAEESAILAEPTYAKWGKLAVEETSKTYRNASIIDYKYEGRKLLPSGKASESFVLWLRKDTREFGVRVTMTIDSYSDKLVKLTITELDVQ
ncbi:DUF3889 domain-containing protein [Paenibacillus sinopodophylli]|uniref:DUF3889 domain-containing protein n=1 Tax=Paenibacillus sinopodophylli TaxID=1837342 RepID=UPI00110CD8D3|nr:DUF3889 domain-containing protein [Paenibacillus sinopodophylli]